MPSLEALREEIDKIDADLVTLLSRRADIVLEVKRAKEKENVDIYSPSRERQILDRVKTLAASSAFPLDALEKIFVNIISATRSLIGEIAVSYLGPEHSLCQVAALKQFGETVRFLPAMQIAEVFRKVERAEAHCGVLPARGSGGGLMEQSYSMLLDSPLVIIAEIEVPEKLVLYSRVGKLSEVKKIYADVSSLAAANTWLKSNLADAELVVHDNCGEAIGLVEKSSDAALISTEHLGSEIDLPVLIRGVGTDPDSDARYLVVGRKVPAPTGTDKTSLVCGVSDRAGALRDLLQPFSSRDITLLRIESRPDKNPSWDYVFFIDVVGHQDDSKVKEAIVELSRFSDHVKVLGSYPMVCHS